jgi:hypothetical protein
MTKKLEELLNLPENKEIINPEIIEEVPVHKKPGRKSNEERERLRDIAEFDKIAEALPAVRGLGQMADDELNDVADKAIKAYEDLMDLGMNVEARYSSRMFEVAGNMLKVGLDARVAKLDKKLKMIELQLKKQKIDSDSVSEGKFTEGSGYVVTDRNSLLDRLKGLDKDIDK